MNKTGFKMALLALAVGFLANSCGEDDGPQASIEGKWNYLKTVTRQNNGPENSIPYPGDEPGCSDDYQQFVDSGVFHNVEYFQDQDDVCQEFVEDGAWSRDGDQLTITRDGQSETYDIILLNNSALRYRQTTVAGGVTFVATLYFTRIN